MKRLMQFVILFLWFLLFVTLIFGDSVVNRKSFDVEAHRGGRDRRPENTLAAFEYAIKLGVDTLEMDTAITKDRVVVISHDPYLNYKITRDNKGEFLSSNTRLFIKNLTFAELQSYDVGRLNPHTKYYYSHREQKAVDGERIPKLSDVFKLAEKLHARNVRFNIEIKTYPPFPEYTIPREEFVKLVLKVIEEYGLCDRVVIQSFDWNALKIVKYMNPHVKIGCLAVEDFHIEGEEYNLMPGVKGASPWLAGFDYDDYRGHLAKMVKEFGGDIVSPYYRELSKSDIKEAHELGLKIVPWTVNRVDTMYRLISWGVDGLITDKPDLLLKLVGR